MFLESRVSILPRLSLCDVVSVSSHWNRNKITNFAVSRLSGRRHIKDMVPNACMLSHFRCV